MALNSLPRWDLSALYGSIEDEAILSDKESLAKKSNEFRKEYRGAISTLNGDQLADATAEYEEISELSGKLSSYAYLVYVTKMTDSGLSAFYQDISEFLKAIDAKLLFFTLEITKLPVEKFNKLLKESAKLAHYKPWLRDVRSFALYQLDEEIENVLLQKSMTARDAWNKLFDKTLASMEVMIGDKLYNLSEVMNMLSNVDGLVREKASKALGAALESQGDLFASITNVLAKDKSIDDDLRGFEKPISSRNVANLIEDEVVDALIDSVKSRYGDLSHRYYKWKSDFLGLDHLNIWDRNAPLDKSEKIYSWDEAVEIVMAAYKEFSPKLAELAEPFFDKNWIDVPPQDGKDSGAFAHPTVPSAHPYLMLNFQGKVGDVMTLAHELGHGVHQRLSASQGFLMSDTPLTLAETASVFGEQLTFQSLLKSEPDEQAKKLLIADKIEDMLNTVVRQIAFCEFERQIHDERKEGEIPLSRINEIWLSVQQESLGDIFQFDESYKMFWSYIPHFIHSPFYVYAYAFGDCLVNSLYAVYQESPDGFEEKYLEMLKAGGTKHHKDLLEPFGLDATDPKFWHKGLDIISGYIDML